MASTLKVDTIVHPTGTPNNLTLDNAGNVTIGNNLTVTGTTTQTGSTTFTGPTYFPNGSVSAPSIAHAGDTNCGFYFGTDIIYAATAGANALTIDSLQNVGIGTTSPTTKLHIYTNSSTLPRVTIESALAGVNADINFKSTVRSWVIGTNVADTSGAFDFYDVTASATRMRIASDGAVAIGSTTTSNGKFSTYITTDGGTALFTRLTGATNNPYFIVKHTESGGVTTLDGNSSTTAYNLALATGGTERARIDQYGSLLVGTTTSPTTTAGLGTISTPGTVAMGSSFKRNRLINGDMRVDQRNAGAATANTINGYTVDRWTVLQSVTGKLIAQQNAGSVTPPAGYTNYLGVTSQSAYTLLSGDYYLIGQAIEGLNIADLGWGSASAKTVTLSFWVRSSLTGQFGGVVRNSATNRCYPFSYTISSANTWTYINITIPGDTTGTWLTTNGVGINLYFDLGTGSTYVGAAGSWSSSALSGATGDTSVVGTNGATFYITGVQLEVGSVATPYERQIYSDQLAQCQRYYYRLSGASASTVLGSICQVVSSTILRPFFPFPVTPRTPPTGIEYSSIGYDNGSSVTAATTTFFNAATSGATVNLAGTGFVTSVNYLPVTAGGAGYIGFTGAEL